VLDLRFHDAGSALSQKQFDHVVAIDGPSGAGKSTMTSALANELGLLYIDTGAMYRALAYYFDKTNLAIEESPELLANLKNLNFIYGKDEHCLIELNGENLTEKIRENQISILASKVSRLPSVREYLLDYQRSLVAKNICVVEGRDIGTVVFPNAFCKIFLTASPEVRAKRRLEQLQKGGQDNVDLDGILEEVIQRDKRDQEREISPLKKATDAIEVNTDQMTSDQAIKKLAELVSEAAKKANIEL
jgi:cytidylate kinase